MDKINVLVFPAGAENAIEIYESLKYNLHFDVYGASGKSDHAEFIYNKDKLYIGNLYITSDSFFDEFNKVLVRFKINYILPTHDTVASFLMKFRDRINARVVCSPYETTMIAENKKITYEALRGRDFLPEIYNDIDSITQFPVFIKPFIGAGGKRTSVAKNRIEVREILEQDHDMLVCEYLPGKEYTVDCFTDRNGKLLFVGPRIRERVTMGITFHSERADADGEINDIANKLNNKFKFRGAWFFQLKEDRNGELKFMEFSVRQAGTMAFYRQLGINFAALSLFDAMEYDVKILFNDCPLILDRCLKNSYRLGYQYEKIYIDFDDTLIVEGKVNSTLMKLVYQCINLDKRVILLTKHLYDLDESLRKYRINKELFDDIILIDPEKKKADYIDCANAVFIDNYFFERLSVKENCNIPVFDVDAIECLIDSSSI